MRIMRLASIALLALVGTACGINYGCADVTFDGHSGGEWCGPLGSFGYHYIDDDVVHVFLTPEEEDDTWSTILDYLPSFGLVFDSRHLEAGTDLGTDQLTGYCSRTDGVPGSGSYTTVVGPQTREVTVESSSNRTATGDPSWRLDWNVACPELDMQSIGNDLIEISPRTDPYDPDLYGWPPDHANANP